MSILIPYNKLSPDQQRIIQRVSTTDDSLFVEGPPGAGKTLISLYVLEDIATRQNIRPLLLMYNNSLYGFLITSLQELNISENITISTKDSFFWNLGKKYGIIPPDHDADYDVKYNFILKNLLKVDYTKEQDITLVDEVQDLRPEEWELIKRFSKKVISLGDFNQNIYNTKIEKESIKSYGIYEQLMSIFRFHKKIAKFANIFSRSGDNLEEKVRVDSSKQPRVIDTTFDNEFSKMADIIIQLKIENKHIGVICPDLARLSSFSVFLNERNIEHNHYSKNKDLRNHDFNSTAPLLIPCLSSKGLEFDKVIVFGFDNNMWSVINLKAKDKLQSSIFVAITRSKSDLFIIRNEFTIDEIKELKEEKVATVDIGLDDIF